MKDILSDINDHEDEFLYGAEEDEEIAPDQLFHEMHSVGDVAGVKPEIPIKLIIERICGQYGYNVSYKKAWFAKQLAIGINRITCYRGGLMQ
ncbi:hypothetical protein PIB30_080985 [Stylosanthes scabra]|uniref:Uncharacterized protein n=1 Tax=Stylosanthes scabra TaxID=79078 RepID=A0ABU6QRQ1_9FABA|nr:hypothetical protein [Stylosanthes scabra]